MLSSPHTIKPVLLSHQVREELDDFHPREYFSATIFEDEAKWCNYSNWRQIDKITFLLFRILILILFVPCWRPYIDPTWYETNLKIEYRNHPVKSGKDHVNIWLCTLWFSTTIGDNAKVEVFLLYLENKCLLSKMFKRSGEFSFITKKCVYFLPLILRYMKRSVHGLKWVEMLVLTFIAEFVWFIQFFWYPYCYGSWHFMSYDICHKMPFYDILWHKSNDIKCNKP